MSIYIFILIGIAVLGYLAIRKFKQATGIPILNVRIGTVDGISYTVEFGPLHPNVKDTEYVRLVLNYLGKMLFVIEKRHDYVSEMILTFISQVSGTNMEQSEIDKFVPDGIRVHQGIATGKVIEGTLLFKDLLTRNILTKLPITWFEHQLGHSVIALLKVTVDQLNDSNREDLKNSLQYMAEAYSQELVSPREMKSMFSLPNEAFLCRHKNHHV